MRRLRIVGLVLPLVLATSVAPRLGGQMHAVEAVLEGRPSDTPRGWK